MCKFGSQICQAFTPQRRFPQVGPWHHVGVTMEITLDKNGSLYDPSGTESCNMQIRLVTLLVRMIYIYIYGTMVTTSCDLQLRPGASPQSRGYVYTGPREVSSLVTDLPGTPVTPRLYIIILVEVLRLFRRYTHTLLLRIVITNFVVECFLHPRWGPLAENNSPESKSFRPMTKGEEPIQLYINRYIYIYDI